MRVQGLAIWMIAGLVSLQAQVVRPANENQSLNARWQWGLKEAKSIKTSDGFWLGYSFEKMMWENSFIGCWHDDRNAAPSLHEMIYGTPSPDAPPRKSDDEELRDAIQDILTELDNPDNKSHDKGEKVLKEVGLFFRYNASRQCQEMRISNLSQESFIDDLPLYWLGKAQTDDSRDHLIDFYTNADAHDVKKSLICAVSLHPESKQIDDFLTKIIDSKESMELRGDAVFWLSQQGSPRALKKMIQLAEKSPSSTLRDKAVFGISQINGKDAMNALIRLAGSAKNSDVREKSIFWLGQTDDPSVVKILTDIAQKGGVMAEKAVFSLSQMSRESALEALIDLATNSKPYITRKNAIFWLGQKVSKRAAESLKDVVYNDGNTDIQKQAVFAISQMPHDESVPLLINIVKTHPNPKIRKNAIFWLGESGAPEAAEIFKELLKS